MSAQQPRPVARDVADQYTPATCGCGEFAGPAHRCRPVWLLSASGRVLAGTR